MGILALFLLNRVIFPGPGEIVAPVPDIEHREHEGEEHSGEHINLLGLELKVLEPQEKFVRLSAGQTVVNDSGRWDDVRALHSPHQRVLVLHILIRISQYNKSIFMISYSKCLSWGLEVPIPYYLP